MQYELFILTIVEHKLLIIHRLFFLLLGGLKGALAFF